METPETLEIFVCETFIVNDVPKLVPSTVVYSMPQIGSNAVRSPYMGVPQYFALPPTASLFTGYPQEAA